MRSASRFLVAIVVLSSITCKDTTTIYEPTGLDNPSIMPVVIYTFPYQNGIGPFDGFNTTVSVRFNKLMDFATLHKAIHWSSAAGDVRPDTSILTLNQGDVASIQPVRTNINVPFRFRVGQPYSITIDTSAHDVNGNRLTLPFTVTFTPEPHFRVKTISPANGTVNVSQGFIQMTFNAPVTSTITSRISIEPPTAGLWHFQGLANVDSTLLLFQSDNTMPSGTAYTVTIPTGTTDRDGDSLAGAFVSTFSTVPFSVTNISPSDGTTGWGVSQRLIQVTLSDAIDTSTIRTSFSLSPPLPGRFVFSLGNPKIFTYQGTADFSPGTVYTISIDTTLKSASGGKLFRRVTSMFATASPRVLAVSFNPVDGDTAVSSQVRVYVNFSQPVDTAAARMSFSITPAVGGLITFPGGNQTMAFSPITWFPPATTFKVTIDTTLKLSDGTHPGVPFISSFRTRPFQVEASSPSDGETHVSVYTGIVIQMSDFVDTSTVRGAFQMNPPVSGTFSMDPGSTLIYFYPGSILRPYSVYSVTISTAIKSTSGFSPPTPKTITFATGS